MRLNLNLDLKLRGHWQTIWGHLAPSPTLKSKKLTHLTEPWVIDLPDGDQLLALVAKHPGQSIQRVLYAFHGLAGSIESDYMRRLAIRVLSDPELRETALVLVNQRGSVTSVRATKAYHGGLWSDFLEVARQGKEKFKAHHQEAIGFSLGGNTLLLGLGQGEPFTPLLNRALAVNPPIDLDSCSAALSQGLSRLYELRFIKLCYQNARNLEKMGGPKAPKLHQLRSLRDFDALYTSKQAGFQSRDEYYQKCSALPHLHRIQIPTSILTSQDDPFVLSGLFQSVPHPALKLHMETWGGHMGYLRNGVRHMDEWILNWLKEKR